MNKISLRIVFLLALSFTINKIYADSTGISPYYVANENGYVFDDLEKIFVENFFATYQTDLGLTSDDQMNLIDSHTENEKSDERYQQYYKGYKVEGGQYLIHSNSGIAQSAWGTLIQNLNIDVSSPISESSALSAALSYMATTYGVTKYAWEDEDMEFAIQNLAEDANTTYYPEGELLIAKNSNNDFIQENYTIAWKFGINSIEPDEHTVYIYVDANNGNIINEFNRWDHANYYNAIGTTTYHGPRISRTAKCSFITCNKFKLYSDGGFGTINKNILKNNGIPGIENMEPKDANNIWDESQHVSPFTAHWAIGETLEYYNNVHGRLSTDGQGKRIGVVMDYDPNDLYGPGKYAAYDRKAINSGTVEFIAVAQNQEGYSPVSLDIMAHEFTHGVINRTSQLNLYNVAIEASALNEGFSDIFAVLTEIYVGVPHNWKIGEYVPFSNPSIRDFINPNSSTPPQPNLYGGTYWDFSNIKKHDNAGVLTKWFSLLANGGAQNGYSLPGIGLAKAEKIAYNTMVWWLWHNVHYPNTRAQSIAYTIWEYGRCSPEHKAVVLAWSAVGVTPSLSGCPIYTGTLQGKEIVKSGDIGTSLKYYLIDGTASPMPPTPPTEPGTITWDVPEGWDVSFSADNSVITLLDVDNYESQILSVTFTPTGGGDPETHYKVIHFIEEEGESKSGKSSNYNIKISDNIKIEQAIKIYPNPANDYIKIAIPYVGDGTTLTLSEIGGKIILNKQISTQSSTIDLRNIPSGLYVIKVTNDKINFVDKIEIFD